MEEDIKMKTDNGETVVLEEWNNRTQIIELFLTKGDRLNNYLIGFNIQDKHSKHGKSSFAPSYKQILSFLSALNTSQFNQNGGDEYFWLQVGHTALIALSKENKDYNAMLNEISKRLSNENPIRSSPLPKYPQDRHIGPIHCGFHLHRFSKNKRNPQRGYRYKGETTK